MSKQYKTDLFNLLSKYEDNIDGNPVSKLMLLHGSAIHGNDALALQIHNLLDVCMSSRVHISHDAGHLQIRLGAILMDFGNDMSLTYNGKQMDSEYEVYGDLVAIWSSGECVLIAPRRYFE